MRLAKARISAGQDVAASEAVLASLASESNSAYSFRIKAALALTGRPHSDLGSGELNLLAGNPAAISAVAADKFYFYEARIRAAQNTADAQTKIQLLSHCIIDFPHRDEARVPLFMAEAGARSDEFALGVLESLLHTQFPGQQSYRARANDDAEVEEIFGSDDTEEDSDETPAPVSTNGTGLTLSRAQQARVAQTIGDTMTRLQRLGDAVSYFEIARGAETSPAARNELKRKIAAAKNELRVRRQNAARQPLLHEPLEQDRVVRPRLVARATPAPRAATVKSGMKQTGLKQGGR